MKVSGQLVKTHTLPHIFLAAEICRVRRQRWTRFTPIVLMMCGANTTTITLRLTSSIIEVKEEPFLSLLHLHMLIHTHTMVVLLDAWITRCRHNARIMYTPTTHREHFFKRSRTHNTLVSRREPVTELYQGNNSGGWAQRNTTHSAKTKTKQCQWTHSWATLNIPGCRNITQGQTVARGQQRTGRSVWQTKNSMEKTLQWTKKLCWKMVQ